MSTALAAGTENTQVSIAKRTRLGRLSLALFLFCILKENLDNDCPFEGLVRQYFGHLKLTLGRQVIAYRHFLKKLYLHNTGNVFIIIINIVIFAENIFRASLLYAKSGNLTGGGRKENVTWRPVEFCLSRMHALVCYSGSTTRIGGAVQQARQEWIR